VEVVAPAISAGQPIGVPGAAEVIILKVPPYRCGETCVAAVELTGADVEVVGLAIVGEDVCTVVVGTVDVKVVDFETTEDDAGCDAGVPHPVISNATINSIIENNSFFILVLQEKRFMLKPNISIPLIRPGA
jgi:hypothetical protein